MKFTYALIAGSLFCAASARAVYAPIPEQEQGKDLSVSVRAGLMYDSNIFGASSGAIGSSVWQLAPRIAYNASVNEQTFVAAHYGLTLDQIDERPGDTLLDSHDVGLRLAHAFGSSTSLDLSETFILARNPESLLNGVPLNTDQSFRRNQVDGRFVTALTPKAGVTVKARTADTRYRNAVLGRSLDRLENLYGLAGDYAVLPELKAVVEVRHLDVYYWTEGELKNKSSNYLMGGLDYGVARKLTLSGRLGAEWRDRAREEDVTSPFIELSGRYQYSERSFLTGGYGYAIDESSDTLRFTDQRTHRLFVNVQHALSALLVASVSANYEPGELQARQSLGLADLSETATRFGAALSYLPTKNWTVSVSYDYDRVRSDDPSRSVERHRAGVSASYAF